MGEGVNSPETLKYKLSLRAPLPNKFDHPTPIRQQGKGRFFENILTPDDRPSSENLRRLYRNPVGSPGIFRAVNLTGPIINGTVCAFPGNHTRRRAL